MLRGFNLALKSANLDERTQVTRDGEKVSECGQDGLRQILQLLMMTFTAVLVIRGTLDIGVVVACNILFARALAPHEQIVTQRPSSRMAWQSYGRLQAWEPGHEVAGLGSRIQLADLRCTIKASGFSSVGRYGQPILQDLDIAVASGEIIVATGNAGCGKTAFLNALTGRVRPTSGTVTWNGFALEQIDSDERSKRLGLLEENPCLGEGDISQVVSSHRVGEFSRVTDATILAGCHEDVLRLPAAYRTEVRAYPFSASLTTKLALARAFYDAPSFLVWTPDPRHERGGRAGSGGVSRRIAGQGLCDTGRNHSVAITRSADTIFVLDGGIVKGAHSGSGVTSALASWILSPQRAAL